MSSENDAAVDVGRLVCSRLDGLMSGAGFAPGQICVSEDEVGVMYCAKAKEFSEQFPLVALEIDASVMDGACTDLGITVELGESPTLVHACLEGVPIEDLLPGDERGGLVPHDSSMPKVPLHDALKRLGGLMDDWAALEISDRGVVPAG